jgi:hypothetical protein
MNSQGMQCWCILSSLVANIDFVTNFQPAFPLTALFFYLT